MAAGASGVTTIPAGGNGGGPAAGFFFRVGGTFAPRYACSESHAVQRTWRMSPSTNATIA